VTPAAIAGVVPSERWIFTKLYEKYYSATAALWFSILRLKAFVNRV
jgi:hypothetical protein